MFPSVADFVVVERFAARVFYPGHVIFVEFVEHFFGQWKRFPLVLPPPSDQLRIVSITKKNGDLEKRGSITVCQANNTECLTTIHGLL